MDGPPAGVGASGPAGCNACSRDRLDRSPTSVGELDESRPPAARDRRNGNQRRSPVKPAGRRRPGALERMAGTGPGGLRWSQETPHGAGRANNDLLRQQFQSVARTGRDRDRERSHLGSPACTTRILTPDEPLAGAVRRVRHTRWMTEEPGGISAPCTDRTPSNKRPQNGVPVPRQAPGTDSPGAACSVQGVCSGRDRRAMGGARARWGLPWDGGRSGWSGAARTHASRASSTRCTWMESTSRGESRAAVRELSGAAA